MAKDLAEKEREFVEALTADTGCDLGTWMSAISASGMDNRNAIIDWLRQQGFAFPKASWLERIHHNGGKLIYGDDNTAPAAVPRPIPQPRALGEPRATSELPLPGEKSTEREPETSIEPRQVIEVVEARPSIAPEPSPANIENSSGADRDEVMKLLSAAKGLRPLAELVLREIEEVVPGTRHALAPPFLLFASPDRFAALLPHAKEIRLYGDFGSDTRDRTRKAEAARGAAPYPDVLVLNDARQLDERFREIVAKAYRRAIS